MQSASTRTAVTTPGTVVAAAALSVGGLWLVLHASKNGTVDTSFVEEAEVDADDHNTQRKAVLATGVARDHDGSVVVKVNPDFDLDQTIFASVEGQLPRLVVKSKLAVKLFWNVEAMNDINAMYATLAPPPKFDKNITEFMETECDFKMEHADGSFMDHLRFCHEYAHRHFEGYSPRVLFLHSIMGVGTNVFPMSADKIPKLRGMLTEFEMRHIEAFPSVLRLLLTRGLIADLKANAHRLDKLDSVSMYRPLDNVRVTLDAQSFWIHLNYHICHLLDFLPVSCWAHHINQDALFMIFADLYAFMKSAGKVMAEVNLELTGGKTSPDGQPLSLGSCIARVLPNAVKLALQEKAIRKLSAAINHSLEYEIRWKPA